MSNAPPRLRWTDAVRDSGLDVRAKVFCFVLATYMNARLEAWPSRATLAEKCSISVSGIDRAIKRARAAGFVDVEWSKGRHPHRYVGTFPNVVTSDAVQAGTDSERTSSPVTRLGGNGTKANVVTSDSSTSSPVTHEPTNEPETPRSEAATMRAGPYRARPLIGDDDFPAWLASALDLTTPAVVTEIEAEGMYAAHRFVVEAAEREARA